MNIRDYQGRRMSFDELSSDLQEAAIKSVMEIDYRMASARRAKELAAYRSMPLHARVNSVFISRLTSELKYEKERVRRMLGDKKFAASFIRENLCEFTVDGTYLTFSPNS